AGSTDLTDGMFRHLVVTGRSRVALYLARIPAGLAVVLPIVAAGFILVCAVCVFAAPTKDSYDGVTLPAGLTLSGFEQWATAHPDEVLCNFSYFGSAAMAVPSNCAGPGGFKGTPPPPPTAASLRASAIVVAQ